MKIIICLAILLIGCSIVKCFRNKNSLLCDFNTERTLPLRGILAVLIILHHLNQSLVAEYGQLKLFGNFIVGVFFFMTGFGLMKSLMKNREAYLSGFIRKRSFRILLPSLIATVVFFLVNHNFDISYYWNRFWMHGSTILPYSWYVVAILYVYLTFYLSFKFVKSYKFALLTFSVFQFVYVWLVNLLGWDEYWWNTLPAVLVGVLYSFNEKVIKYYWEMRKIVGLLLLTLPFGLSVVYAYLNSRTSMTLPYADLPMFSTFPVFVVGIVCILGFHKNKFLDFLGTISYEIYLLQGIFIYQERKLFPELANNIYFSFVIVVVLTVFSAFILKKLCDRIMKLIN